MWRYNTEKTCNETKITRRRKETGEWRKLRNEILQKCSSRRIVIVIKLRRIKRMGHVTLSGLKTNILVAKSRLRRPRRCLDARLMLKWKYAL